MGTFQAIYEGGIASTLALAAIAFVAAASWFRRRTFVVAYAALFTMVALADAIHSGPWSPLRSLSPAWESGIGMVFVLVGDYRYFLVVERFAARPDIGAMDATPRRAWLGSFAWMALVPLVTLAISLARPSISGRLSYLAYELLFIALVLVWRFVRLKKKLAPASDDVRKWLFDVTSFELGTYGLWALSDILILAGIELGYLLRIVPNVLYYGLFAWFVAFRAPAAVVKEPAS